MQRIGESCEEHKLYLEEAVSRERQKGKKSTGGQQEAGNVLSVLGSANESRL